MATKSKPASTRDYDWRLKQAQKKIKSQPLMSPWDGRWYYRNDDEFLNGCGYFAIHNKCRAVGRKGHCVWFRNRRRQFTYDGNTATNCRDSRTLGEKIQRLSLKEELDDHHLNTRNFTYRNI